jgi:hypothetical protein
VNEKKIVVIVLAVICGSLGFALAFVGVKGLLFESGTQSWPRTLGVISSAEIIAKDGRYGRVWCAQWTYTYTVDGKDYVGDKPTFGTNSCHRGPKSATQEAQSHGVGVKIPVVYQPDAPRNAALALPTGVSFFKWFLTVSGAALFMIACGMLFISPSSRK